MDKKRVSQIKEQFDLVIHSDENTNVEFWFARELMPLLGYERWENFDKAIKDTYDLLKDDDSAAIIVTSTHETGGLRYNGELKEDINSMDLITYDGHTLVDVPYYMYFGNKELEIDKISNIIDNTDIYKNCKALLSD